MIIDVALTMSTVLLTHATYRAVPAEHKERAKHHVRRTVRGTWSVLRALPGHMRHVVCAAHWLLTTPFRRREGDVSEAAVIAIMFVIVIVVSFLVTIVR